MQARKTVSILFCDVVDSTPLGEQLDPESLQRVMSRWFAEARTIVERHGGTVEKFIGDEVMAVFGVPVIHEDDALRAVRSAAALRDRLETLNDELEALFGVRLAVRIGVNTGEVVVGDPSSGSTFVTGEPVNLAKRLEQAANPGQILIGKATYPLVENAVRAGPLESFSVKGKRDIVSPWTVEHVDEGAAGVARRLDAPLVGRTAELARLADAFAAVLEQRTCRLVTVIGPAGIGKTRLADELKTQLGSGARVLTGRCLPYGDGITFWPLIEILRTLGGDGLDVALAAADDRESVIERLQSITGGSDSGAVDELFWAARRLLEELGGKQPLVLILEDLDRGEPTLFDLVDYLHSRIDKAPVLVLGLARPELLDRRPEWAAPRERAEMVVLDPLSESDAAALLTGLAADIDEHTCERVLRSAEGNPLYVEQLAALAETGEVVVPPTIQALLAERLDRLEAGERAILERAAIVGQEFSRRAVTDLCPPELRAEVGRHLLALVRKDFVRPHASVSSTEDGYRFRHLLIREVAYEAMAKEARALFHEWFADWTERNAGERATELEEIVGYHLEQAVRLRGELGPSDSRSTRLAGRAATVLGRAGRRAYERDDMPAALNLLDRALALMDESDPARLELMRELSTALWAVGELARAEALLNGILVAAAAAGNRQLELYAQLEQSARRSFTQGSGSLEESLAVARGAIPSFEELGDPLGLTRAWRRISQASRMLGRLEEAEEAGERAVEYARLARRVQEEARGVDMLCSALLYGPAAVPRAIARCEELMDGARRSRLLEANVAVSLAALKAMAGLFDDARELYPRSEQVYAELGLRLPGAGLTEVAGKIELLAGRPADAECHLRRGYDVLAEAGMQSFLSFQASLLAEAIAAQGRLEEALVFAEIARDTSAEDDVFAAIEWRIALGAIRTASGDIPEALALTEEAVELAERTDALNVQADALAVYAQAAVASGLEEHRTAASARALALYRRKGNLAAAMRLEPASAL